MGSHLLVSTLFLWSGLFPELSANWGRDQLSEKSWEKG